MYSKEDYQKARLQLLPQGKLINKDKQNDNSDLYKLMQSLAYEDERINNRIHQLIDEADPTTATETLSDWERVLNLPDESGVKSDTERRTTIIQELLGSRAYSEPPLKALASSFNYSVSFEPFGGEIYACGAGGCGDRMYDLVWNNRLVIKVAGCINPPDKSFEQVLKKVALANLILIFEYK